jgi:hypothetical protein
VRAPLGFRMPPSPPLFVSLFQSREGDPRVRLSRHRPTAVATASPASRSHLRRCPPRPNASSRTLALAFVDRHKTTIPASGHSAARAPPLLTSLRESRPNSLHRRLLRLLRLLGLICLCRPRQSLGASVAPDVSVRAVLSLAATAADRAAFSSCLRAAPASLRPPLSAACFGGLASICETAFVTISLIPELLMPCVPLSDQKESGVYTWPRRARAGEMRVEGSPATLH